MKYLIRILLVIFLIMSLSGCGSSSKTRNIKRKTIMINTTQLGKNKYFFSGKYQRKLSRKRRRKK